MSGYTSTCVVCSERLTPTQTKLTRGIMATAGWHPENIAWVGDRCEEHLKQFLDYCDKHPRFERMAYRKEVTG